RPWAEALAIRGSRIVAVGTTDSLRRLAGPRTRMRDVGGRTVIPGLNDAHAHPGPELRGTKLATATGDGGLLEIARSLAAAARLRPRGTWLFATVGDRVLDDQRANRFLLDSIVPDDPVVLESWSGHTAVLNSATLGALGIGHGTPDPLGGHYGRVPGSGGGGGGGVLDGRMTEYAWWNARRRARGGAGRTGGRRGRRGSAGGPARAGGGGGGGRGGRGAGGPREGVRGGGRAPAGRGRRGGQREPRRRLGKAPEIGAASAVG